MRRRVDFLDNLPGFNLNSGVGECITVDGKKRKTDTKKLGSTLMMSMLNEVKQFCDPEQKEDWTKDPHQQVLTITSYGSYHFLNGIKLSLVNL